MKQIISPCGVVAAAGNEESLKAILQILRDVQVITQATGPPLRITKAGTITEIKQAVAASGTASVQPEILVYSMSQKDAACIDDLLMISGKNPQLQTVLLVRQDSQAQIAYRCRKYPIYVLSLPLRRQILMEMLRMILMMRSLILEKDEELQRMRKKLNEIGLVTKAKCLLIQMRQMTEEEAHYYLEKRAMDDGLAKREVAAEIIRMYS